MDQVYSSRLQYFGSDEDIDVSILSREHVNYRPVIPATGTSNTVVQFEIPAHTSMFYDLGASNLFVRLKVVKKGGAILGANDNVFPVQCFLHSLWSNVTILLNNRLVYNSDTLSPYKGYIETLCTAQNENKNIGFWKETGTGEPTETEVTGRSSLFATSTVREFAGPIPSDLNQWTNLLPNNISVSIKLTPNDPKFCLLAAADTVEFEINVQEIYFQLVRCTISPSVYSIIRNNLEKHPAKIPYKSGALRAISIPTDSYSFINERVFSGAVPYMVLVGVVKAENFNGKYSKNPFHFENLGISHIVVSTDDNEAAFNIQSPDFASNKFLDAYLKFSRAIGNVDERIINKDTWKNGKTLFAFDLSPRISLTSQAIPRIGNVRLEIRFKDKITEPAVAIVYALFQNQLYISKDRSISFLEQ